ncbi:RNA polymerase sigma factor [Viscerimonas tarda]
MDILKKMTDEELVVSYYEGNSAAFDCLLERHNSNLFNYIYFIVKNKELTEDIFQETFIKAIVMIQQGRYTETGKFRAWITRIAHNLIIDHFRQKKNENTISNDNIAGDLLNNASFCESTIEDILVQDQIMTDVQKLIKQLPENQRKVLEMRYYQDLSFKEISEITGVSINTALGRMRYAILNMRKLAEENKMILTL